MACQNGSISELRPSKVYSRILSIRHISRNENRIIQRTSKISLHKRHRLLTTRNVLASKSSKLDSQRTPKSRPTRPSARVFGKPSPRTLHILAQSDLGRRHRSKLVRGRECAPNLRNLRGVVCGGVFEEFCVGEGSVVLIAPDPLSAGELDCRSYGLRGAREEEVGGHTMIASVICCFLRFVLGKSLVRSTRGFSQNLPTE
jgi:hypothetical protein